MVAYESNPGSGEQSHGFAAGTWGGDFHPEFGTADEIGKAAVFLASDDSSYITGTELFVDGGIAQV